MDVHQESAAKILEDMKCTEKVENVCSTPTIENPES